MAISTLEDLSDAQRQELIASLSAIVVGGAGGEVSAESLSAAATAAGCDLSGAWASIFASAVSKVCARCLINRCHFASWRKYSWFSFVFAHEGRGHQ